MTNVNEFDGFLALIVDEIGRGKGSVRVRDELVALCGAEAGVWFDGEYPAHEQRFVVFVHDWTGASS
jgi:hypothetical protein